MTRERQIVSASAFTLTDAFVTTSSCITRDNNSHSHQLHPNVIALYQTREFWKKEMSTQTVEEWTVEELTNWIQSRIHRAGYNELGEKPNQKCAHLIEKLIHVIKQQDITGGLLLAGGKSYLGEKASSVLCKREKARLHHALAFIFSIVEEAKELQGVVPYWQRLWMSSAAGNALYAEYEGTDQGAKLRLALKPCPLADIRYTKICHLEAANDVLEADLNVDKMILPVGIACRFLVVSVAPREDPTVVWSNLIYVRNDLHVDGVANGSDDFTSATAGATKRQRKRGKRKALKHRLRWELIASVDFSQHGSALPGHWHLNRTSNGDLVPHLSLGIGDEDSHQREVWHGHEDGCPLWWQFIPNGMVYKEKPRRLLLSLDCLR